MFQTLFIIQILFSQVLFRSGDVADEMFSVMSGSVEKIEEDPATGMELVTGVMKKGSALGELSFAFGMKHLYTARAKEPRGCPCMCMYLCGCVCVHVVLITCFYFLLIIMLIFDF